MVPPLLQIAETPEKGSPKKIKAVETKENVKTEEDSKKTDANLAEEKQQKTNTNPPEPPKDYIHVRARRGQATDSHSLAERVSEQICSLVFYSDYDSHSHSHSELKVRREKISERMKLLQDLVPGCNKVGQNFLQKAAIN